ncbi:cytochrome c oxidase assembly factor Coa1 family protein [uncultured Roseibium sp.]|uniref:cytochrome c oxidase assembly factor Coa1 family protein n=1 Tax=uncultured Roseibium sp. TaxID=1936171 RepID=UPI003217AC90
MTSEPLNQPPEIPPELDRWNWGAFLLNWIWGIGNSVFIALLMFVPLVNLVMFFVLGARGSRWAWRNRAWRDAEHFRSTQRKWAIAGVIVWIVTIGLGVGIVAGLPAIMKSSDAYAMTMAAVRNDAAVEDALGGNIESGFWINGSINVEAGGTGTAYLNFSITGSKGSGRAITHAVRTNGIWELRVLVVYPEGTTVPIVLENKANVSIPGAPQDL